MKREEAIKYILKQRLENANDLMMVKRKAARLFGVGLIDNAEILRFYKNALQKGEMKEISGLDLILRKRAVRTMSGIAPVAVLTKPFDCPGTCAYCPREKDVPVSYLSNEPAVMRAIRCAYNPYVQVQDRLRALLANGHEPSKIELIVIGGTWSVLPKKYKHWYIANLFAGANDFASLASKIKSIAKQSQSKSGERNEQLSKIFGTKEKYNYSLSQKDMTLALQREQKKNEQAEYRIIGLTLETRPDYINDKELDEMRELGCTRVELGVQALDDAVLDKNKRGHGVEAISFATKLLKNRAFKITYHIMPGLPGSSPAKDRKMFDMLFEDERFQPDQLKFYPTVVTKGSLLYDWWKKGEYKPYNDKQLKELIVYCKKKTPEYVRIIRLIRDIPGESIEAGNKITNLRQIMQVSGVECACIRCREIKDGLIKGTKQKLEFINYRASGGEEYFLQIVDEDRKLLGFCRLRLPDDSKIALIRELHVYGKLVPPGKEKKIQHSGFGKRLMMEAEKIAKEKDCFLVRVISGVGVRAYYRKLGYRLKKSYMEKNTKTKKRSF